MLIVRNVFTIKISRHELKLSKNKHFFNKKKFKYLLKMILNFLLLFIFLFNYSVKFNLIKKIQLSAKKVVLSNINYMTIHNKFIYLSHERGNKISIFDFNGQLIKTITNEELWGPGQNRRISCIQIVPFEDKKVCFLFKGFVNELVIFDISSNKFKYVPFQSSTQKIINNITAIALKNEYEIYLLKHPQRVLGQNGNIRIAKLKDKKIDDNFIELPKLKYPLFTEYFAERGDHLILFDNIIYFTAILEKQIYLYDLSGNLLSSFVYPKNFLIHPDQDLPSNLKRWSNFLSKIPTYDKIINLFPIKDNQKTYLLVSRVRNRSNYFDIFDDTGKIIYSKDQSNIIKENTISISDFNNQLYVLKWPDVSVEQFEVYGNPEIWVYKLYFYK